METAPVESRPGWLFAGRVLRCFRICNRCALVSRNSGHAAWHTSIAQPNPKHAKRRFREHNSSKQPEPRRLGMARSVSPTRAGSPGRKSASRGRPDAIVGLSEDELKSFAGSGSLPIDEDELSAAFDFFDVEGRGKLTVADLKLRLGAFYKNLPVRRRLHCHLGCQPAPARPAFACPQPKEYKTLINEPNFTKETLKNLLANNELGQFDPVKEAFKVYDPHGAPHAPLAGSTRTQLTHS